MSDPFSIAGTAAGLVSLGIQVCQGLVFYIDGARGRKGDLRAISSETTNLKLAIDVINNMIPGLSPNHIQITSTTVSPALQTCEVELTALRDLLTQLSDSSTPPAGPLATIQGQAKKLTYPFRRQNLEILERKLQSANGVLQTATAALQISITSSTEHTVSEVKINTATNSVHLNSLMTDSQTLRDLAVEIKASLDSSNATTSSIEQKLKTFAALASRALSDIDSRVTSITSSLSSMRTTTEESLHILKQQQATVQCLPSIQHHTARVLDLQTVQASKFQLVQATVEQGTDTLKMELSDVKDYVLQLQRLFLEDKREREMGFTLTPTQRVLRRLVSSPSDLSQACDTFQTVTGELFVADTRSTQTVTKHSGCFCRFRTRTITERRFTPFRDVVFTDRTTVTQRHQRGCLHYQPPSKSRTLQAGLYGLRKLFACAVELSITSTTGAGGRSISPNIIFRPMVNMYQSPLFRVLSLLHSETYHIDQEQIELVVARASQLIHRGKSSPYEVDWDSKSALYRWAMILTSFYMERGALDPQLLSRSIIPCTKVLLQAGLSASSVDSGNTLPVSHLAQFVVNWDKPTIHHLFGPVIRELFDDSTDYTASVPKYRDQWWECQPFPDFATTPETAEVLGFGPLSMAIVNNDYSRVKFLLERSPESLDEVNYNDWTPFHLAAAQCSPLSLVSLLDASNDSSLWDKPDVASGRALDHAILYSGKICSSGSHFWKLCSNDCSCTAGIEALEASGWKLGYWSRAKPYHYSLCKILLGASERGRIRMIQMMKSAYSELVKLGLRHLDPFQIRDYELDQKKVLDGQATQVVTLLLRKGIALPAALPSDVSLGRGRSVYHEVLSEFHRYPEDSNIRLLNWLWSNDFRDVDQPDSTGMTPLLFVLATSWFSLPYRNRRHGLYYWDDHPGETSDMSIVLWLVDHGANLSRPWPQARPAGSNLPGPWTPTVAHSVSWLLATHYTYTIEARIQLFRIVASLQIGDGCRCACSAATGCHSMTSLLHEEFTRYSFNSMSPKEIISRFTQGLYSLTEELSRRKEWCILVLRYTTFYILGLRHTCCGLWTKLRFVDPWNDDIGKITATNYSYETIAEIEDEDRDRLHLLEDLVKEFTEQYHDWEPQADNKLADFLLHYWAPRVKEVLQELKAVKLTEEEKLAAEKIGVRWQDSDDSQDSDTDCSIESEEDQEDSTVHDLPWFQRRLDEIAPLD